MFHNRRLEIIAIVAVLAFVAIFVVTSTFKPQAEFSGSDEVGSAQISSITGIAEENFTPLVPQWVPPSVEIESALFGIQAAIGGIILGFVFGYWIGRKKDTSD